MTRRDRADRILAILDQYVPAPTAPLDHGDAFQLLVAVMLSAQCTDARVNQVTPALFAHAPDARAMAKLNPGEILPFIRTCGLAGSKASNLHAMSKMLLAQYGGAVPHELAELEKLPGIGHKTASVVVAQAFHEPAFPVDTHIHRLAGRWGLSRARSVEEVERDLKAVFPRERWAALHLQIIYFGRGWCTAKAHDPEVCPVCSWAMSKARARAEKRQQLSKPEPKHRAAKRAAVLKARETARREAREAREAAKPEKARQRVAAARAKATRGGPRGSTLR